jgi:hypothetical protein
MSSAVAQVRDIFDSLQTSDGDEFFSHGITQKERRNSVLVLPTLLAIGRSAAQRDSVTNGEAVRHNRQHQVSFNLKRTRKEKFNAIRYCW